MVCFSAKAGEALAVKCEGEMAELSTTMRGSTAWLLECYSKGLVRSHKVIIRAPPLQMGEQLWRLLDAIPNFGSSALPVLSNKEKAARTGLVRQLTPTHCVKDDFLGELSLNAVLHWFL